MNLNWVHFATTLSTNSHLQHDLRVWCATLADCSAVLADSIATLADCSATLADSSATLADGIATLAESSATQTAVLR